MQSTGTSQARFVTLIFRGARFEDAAMPVPVLSELIAYQAIVMEVARHLYMASQPARLRLPKGFEAAFGLALKGVEKGSAMPEIVRVSAPAWTPQLAFGADWFEHSRDLIEATIDAAANGRDLPSEFPLEILPRFTTFGRLLEEDESIIVAQPGTTMGATYDRHVRKALILRAQGTYEDEVNLVGEVRAADRDNEGFAIRMEDDRKLQVHTPRAFLPLAMRSLVSSASVRVRGTGLFDSEGNLLKVTMASDVSLAEDGDEQTRPGCPTPVETQVESLKALAPGWFDPTSPAFEPAKLDWLSKLLLGVLDGFQLPRPYIYPMPDGLTRAEWPGAKWDVRSNFDLDAQKADLLAVGVDSDDLHELTLPLTEPGAESKLGRFLQQHLVQHAS
jgi:hypothetical protein